MQISSFDFLSLLKPKLGEKEARVLKEYVEAKAEEKISSKKDLFLTKDDGIRLIEKIEKVRSDIIKWMFIFWVGQIGVIIAILTIFFK